MRAFIFAANRALIGELSPSDILEMTRVEEINGEHSLTVRTLAVLSKGQRLLVKDDDGRFREWVVTGEDTSHAAGESAIGTYECVWSLQYDFSGFVVKTMPGTVSPVSVTEALTAAFPSGHGWQVGTVTRQATGGASFWYKSSWEALSILLSVWGGEVDAEISVTDGVITRRVCVYDAIGEQTPHRRFDYGHDMPTIRRTVAEDLMTCRIIPRGKGEETESGGYGRKIGIEDVNGGIEWLQNDQAAQLLAYTVDGVTRYPTQVVENPDMETPEQLLEWARSVLDSYTTPHVAYEADVTQFARTGLDAHGIGLGDAVQCVDREFLSEGLRVQGRVMRMEANELDPTDMTLTIGNLTDSIADYVRGLQVQLSAFGDRSESWEAAANADSTWLRALVANLNAAYNQAGTYHFSSFEKGEIWSSVPLDENGRATKTGGWAINLNGAGFRIASGLKPDGSWNWRTFGTGNGFTADALNSGTLDASLVTIKNLMRIGQDGGWHLALASDSITMTDKNDATALKIQGVASSIWGSQTSYPSYNYAYTSLCPQNFNQGMRYVKVTLGCLDMYGGTYSKTYTIVQPMSVKTARIEHRGHVTAQNGVVVNLTFDDSNDKMTYKIGVYDIDARDVSLNTEPLTFIAFRFYRLEPSAKLKLAGGNDEVLTRQNFCEQMGTDDVVPYTGTFTLTYAFNNILRYRDLTFKDGLLISVASRNM